MGPFLKRFLTQKREVNYLYFSFFLVFLTLLSLLHYKEQPITGIPLFFILYAVGQAFLEVCVFILLAYVLKRWTPSWIHLAFIGTSFILLIFHFTHFIMVRLMDAPLSYLFKFFFGSGVDHLIAGFQALNMNWTMIAIIIGTFLIIPVLGLGFYALTAKMVQRKPLHLSLNQIGITIAAISATLLLLDIVAHPFLNRSVYTKYQKTLPLGTTFLAPTKKHIALLHPFSTIRDEKETQKHLPRMTLAHRPNIFFFIIETLRKDFLYAAPHLTQFAKDHIDFPSSFSNANSTYLSWFALFHSDFPFHWATMRDTWEKGSIPLQILKNLGYKIKVYSSADLRYFNMDNLIFGNDRKLADSIEEYSFDRNIQPCDRDALAINALKRDLTKEGNVYLIFLDATHSEYSFPKDFPLKYEPISKEIDYLTIGPKSPELELIKNRYRNAIAYIDSLMGDFFEKLKKEHLFDDAIISITGDHGEEFFEEGALFHGTHLNHYQTSVPILLKFPSKDWLPQTQEATHLDLFPSILHYLTKQSDFTSLFDGRSIFSLERLPFRIAVLQNGPDTPIEFSVENSDVKLRALMIDDSKLEIVDLQGFLEPDIFYPLIHKP